MEKTKGKCKPKHFSSLGFGIIQSYCSEITLQPDQIWNYELTWSMYTMRRDNIRININRGDFERLMEVIEK